jgi:hypothetical protein
MTPDRDPELGGRLERALPSHTARYGQKERVRRSLDERFERERSKIALWPFALAATIALVLASALWKRPTATTTVASARSSLLTLTTASIAVRADAQLAVERDDSSGTLVRLSSGTILVHVEKGTGRPFAVLAGSMRVDVIGTFFAVSLHTGATSIDVFEGVVRVTDAAGAHLARAGDRYPAGADPLSPTNDEVALLSAPFGSKTAQAASASPGAPPSAEPRAPPGAGSSTAAPRARVPSRATPDAYASAKDLERSGATDAALEIYAKVANAGGRNMEDALFAIVRLRSQAGESHLALEATDRYRAAFPAGRYARAVDVHALNARLAQSDDAGVLQEAAAFLDAHGSDPRAFKFRLGRAMVLARRGNCRGALEAIEGVPQSPAKQAVLAACPWY